MVLTSQQHTNGGHTANKYEELKSCTNYAAVNGQYKALVDLSTHGIRNRTKSPEKFKSG